MIDKINPKVAEAKPPHEGRRERLVRREVAIRKGMDNLQKLRDGGRKTPIDVIRIRHDFVFRTDAVPASDRKLPSDRVHLPPSTRLITSRGSKLQFFLTALFDAQARTRPGRAPTNDRPISGSGQTVVGWLDLLALDAQSRGRPDGKPNITHMQKKDHLKRQIDRTLASLHEEELVDFPNSQKTRGKKENFVLMHEGGRRKAGDNTRYEVPKNIESRVFEVPVELFTQGWIYVLEDSELALLLMAASLYDPKKPDRAAMISGEDRLTHYGIIPNTFDKHEVLSALGLLEVVPDQVRYPDGRVPNYDPTGEYTPLPHAIRFLPDGLKEDAHKAILDYL